jgi:alpha-glucosidase
VPSPSGPPFDGVGYQVYPRSFLDASGDGIGDLAGLERRLDHLTWLGVDAVWLSPIYPSPMADFGYDVADHTGVDPVFGSVEDAEALIAAAHRRGLQVWLDWVPNHTSDQHPWFLASRSSREDPKRDWYVWRDPAPDGGPPNNWTRHFADGAPAWTLDETTGQYYLHLFLPEQPDLNWDHPEVRAAMCDVLRTWKRRGVDGFRADVVHLIGKDPDLADDPAEFVGLPRAGFHDREETFPHLREIRATLDEEPTALMVGEVNLPDAARVVRYVGDDRLPLAFHFGLVYCPWEAQSWRETIRYVDARFAEAGRWPTWVVGNHDQPRVRTRTGSEARARAAAVVLLTLRGVPFLYAGDELGLEDADVPADRVVDPGGRDGCRAPIPWDASARPRLGGRAVAALAARRRDPQRRGAARGPGLDPVPAPRPARRPARQRGAAPRPPRGARPPRRRARLPAPHRRGGWRGGRRGQRRRAPGPRRDGGRRGGARPRRRVDGAAVLARAVRPGGGLRRPARARPGGRPRAGLVNRGVAGSGWGHPTGGGKPCQ